MRLLRLGFNFDIDEYLNPYLRPPPFERLPYCISRFLGYRQPGELEPDTNTSTKLLWAFLGEFCAVAVLINTFRELNEYLKNAHVPAIIASFGASGILLFNAIESPLGQPRQFIFSHFISAIIGISFTKIFQATGNFRRFYWLCAALSTSLSSVAMIITGTVHPPAGATALLASVNQEIRDLGWQYLLCILISNGIMLIIALLFNNIQRRYPRFWWTPKPLPGRGLQSDNERCGKCKRGLPIYCARRIAQSCSRRSVVSGRSEYISQPVPVHQMSGYIERSFSADAENECAIHLIHALLSERSTITTDETRYGTLPLTRAASF